MVLKDLLWHSEQPLAVAVFAPVEDQEDQENTEEDSPGGEARRVRREGPREREAVQFLGADPAGGGRFHLRYRGCEQRVRCRSEKEFQLEQFMLPAAESKDTSNCLLSPMPGASPNDLWDMRTLISIVYCRDFAIPDGQDRSEGRHGPATSGSRGHEDAGGMIILSWHQLWSYDSLVSCCRMS